MSGQKIKKNYYLGLDIGTDSIGYAVTNDRYDLLKYHSVPAWGVHIFDEASLNEERRMHRTARRRLDRRQQRVSLLQELFAHEIAAVDPHFFLRLRESTLYRTEAGEKFTLFNDNGCTDAEYYAQYPTIHHLICDLMDDPRPHDVRLVYLACAWLVSHRGHFLSNIDKNNLSDLKDFSGVYGTFCSYFKEREYAYPWSGADVNNIGETLKKRIGVSAKEKELTTVLIGGKKASKTPQEDFPFSQAAIIKLLSGGTCKLKDLFGEREEYAELGSFSLDAGDDKLEEISANIGDDFELITVLRGVYDWAVLTDVLGDAQTISQAKVQTYDIHKTDLALLKRIIKKYCPEKYDEMFRATDKDNYSAYSYHTDDKDAASLKRKGKEDFSKYVLSVIKDVVPEKSDAAEVEDMRARLSLRTFMPKQRDGDNRVIPHQLYWFELSEILKKAQGYLPFLLQKDENGLSTAEKIQSIFLFRVPYFVGPLNMASEHAWAVRKPGKIYPWNFEKMVDSSNRT